MKCIGMVTRIGKYSLILVASVLILGGTALVHAWTGPTQAPPNGNVSAPVNVGTTNQVKNGGLSVNTLAVFGSALINSASPTLYLQDSDHRSAMIHSNSNLLYFLRGCGVGSQSWCALNGYWPLYLNLENNNAFFGGSVYAPVGSMRAQLFYDNDNTAYYMDPAGTTNLNTVQTGALTASAVVRSTSGGFQFPDGTIQTTAASGGGADCAGGYAHMQITNVDISGGGTNACAVQVNISQCVDGVIVNIGDSFDNCPS